MLVDSFLSERISPLIPHHHVILTFSSVFSIKIVFKKLLENLGYRLGSI